MSSVRERRESISRDLDAFLSRLHDLRTSQWNLPTPDAGWEIRHLAAHLVGTIGGLNGALRQIVNPDIAVALMSADAVTADTEGEDIIGSLTVNRNALVATLAEFTTAHLTAETGEIGNFFPPTGDNYLDIAVTEAGVHLYDINAALDRGSAGLSSVSVVAANHVFELLIAPMANSNPIKPDGAVSFRFEGSLIDRWMTWTGKGWVVEEVAGVPVTHIHADDTSIVLFICGRIPASDHRLGVSGNREPLLQFKTWIPGP